jgi:hypothetical protein
MTGAVLTIKVKVFVDVAPQLSVAVTVTVYVPDGEAFVTEITPVPVLPENVPAKPGAAAVNVETDPLSVGVASGVTVKFEANATGPVFG